MTCPGYLFGSVVFGFGGVFVVFFGVVTFRFIGFGGVFFGTSDGFSQFPPTSVNPVGHSHLPRSTLPPTQLTVVVGPPLGCAVQMPFFSEYPGGHAGGLQTPSLSEYPAGQPQVPLLFTCVRGQVHTPLMKEPPLQD
ncbi:MAG: hypothetical protein WBF58_17955 [Xanthobacteraceae bacterium]